MPTLRRERRQSKMASAVSTVLSFKSQYRRQLKHEAGSKADGGGGDDDEGDADGETSQGVVVPEFMQGTDLLLVDPAERWLEACRDVDKARTGLITQAQLEAIITRFAEVTPEEAEAIANDAPFEVDAEGDARVRYTEFIRGAVFPSQATLVGQCPLDAALAACQEMDHDEDGFITAEQLRYAVEWVHSAFGGDPMDREDWTKDVVPAHDPRQQIEYRHFLELLLRKRQH